MTEAFWRRSEYAPKFIFGMDIVGAGAVIVVYVAIPAQTTKPLSNSMPDAISAGPGTGVSTCDTPAATAK